MSYCRFGPDSQVYVYGGHGIWECCGCRLFKDRQTKSFKSLTELKAHLDMHVAYGHKVPDYAFERIVQEQQTGVGRLSGAPIAEEQR